MPKQYIQYLPEDVRILHVIQGIKSLQNVNVDRLHDESARGLCKNIGIAIILHAGRDDSRSPFIGSLLAWNDNAARIRRAPGHAGCHHLFEPSFFTTCPYPKFILHRWRAITLSSSSSSALFSLFPSIREWSFVSILLFIYIFDPSFPFPSIEWDET